MICIPLQPKILFTVRNLINARATNDTITVTWDAADICSGIVTYFVKISTANGTLLVSASIRNYLQFTFTDLMSNASYTITVIGANEFGNGTITVLDVTTGAVPQGIDIIFATHCDLQIMCFCMSNTGHVPHNTCAVALLYQVNKIKHYSKC